MSVEVTDFTTGQIDRYTQVGTILPSTCRVGHIFFLVGASPNKVYACFSSNVWTEVISGDTVGAFPRTVSTITVAARATSFGPLNFRSSGSSSALPAGLYRVTVYVNTVTTQADHTFDNFELSWTDDISAKTDLSLISPHSLSSTTIGSSGTKMIKSNGLGDISLGGGVIDPGTATYQVYAICERVG